MTPTTLTHTTALNNAPDLGYLWLWAQKKAPFVICEEAIIYNTSDNRELFFIWSRKLILSVSILRTPVCHC